MSKKKRREVKYPALKKQYNLRSRQDLIDYDYIKKLSPSEKEWLNKFTEEYLNASFSKNKEENLHNIEQERAVYRMNNNRNADFYNRRLKHKDFEGKDIRCIAVLFKIKKSYEGLKATLNPEEVYSINQDLQTAQMLSPFEAMLSEDYSLYKDLLEEIEFEKVCNSWEILGRKTSIAG